MMHNSRGRLALTIQTSRANPLRPGSVPAEQASRADGRSIRRVSFLLKAGDALPRRVIALPLAAPATEVTCAHASSACVSRRRALRGRLPHFSPNPLSVVSCVVLLQGVFCSQCREMVRLCRRCLVPAVLWLACLLCTLQMLAAFVGHAEEAPLKGDQSREARRLRPRHVGGETEVRGRTYQRHGAEPLDARHRELHSERLRLNRLARPHLVARRQIFSEYVNGAQAKVHAILCFSSSVQQSQRPASADILVLRDALA
ncbi:uncharacterized protein LOC119434706 isoform X1 [Dermacentor silvarum]|uniref:uncharacterized protein LOC119434706 isoform X1 n=1 Tax=Dermacentor silvarum TaxID=543639 RepID=UPI0021015273|nr:uncharacterized protein LOC119434706 isoform X1 [Dermacentor silvarum]